MELDPKDDIEAIADLVRDGFQTPPTYTVAETCQHIMAKVRDHGGKWPVYMTGSYAQCRHWEADMALSSPMLHTKYLAVLTIMNVRVIERPGAITLIWSEALV